MSELTQGVIPALQPGNKQGDFAFGGWPGARFE